MNRVKLKSSLLWLVIAVATLAISTTDGQQVGTNCSEPRVRRSWDMYNATEKSLYLEAVGLAMDKNLHAKFVQIHIEYMSEKSAHQNCMFIYWHRMMLLGYQNMLRSLDPKFRCVTLPYWDHLAAKARDAATNCRYLSKCSPDIIADFGGTASSSAGSMQIYNQTFSSISSSACVRQTPLSRFCGGSSSCSKCVFRKTTLNMATTAYPASASFSSVYNQLFSSSSYTTFSNAVEVGVHNTIHSSLGGIMGYLQSPADPIFYLHHGLIDLLQVIYLKCQVGGENIVLSADAKGSDSRWFGTCPTRFNTKINYTPADNITMRGYNGSVITSVWLQDPTNILYPFFKDLPYKYVDYVDAKDLGNYSYTYAISGGLANLYKNCKASNTISSASVNSTTTLMEDEVMVPSNYKEHLYPVIEPGTSYDDKVNRWNIALYESARIVGYEEAAAREQVEMVMCQYQEDCLGGVDDYTELFKTNFHADGHPRCYTVLQYLNSGDRVIGIPQWKEITSRFLPCSKYKPRPKSAFENAFSKYADGLTGTTSTAEAQG